MSSEYKILRVNFEGAHRVKADSLWQWDYGQVLLFKDLDLPAAYEVHFSNDVFGEAEPQVGTADGVRIPDQFLEVPASIYAWVYLHDSSTDGETEYTVEIPINRRAKPKSVSVTNQEQRTFTQMMGALNEALENAGDTAKAVAQAVLNTKVDKVAGKGLSTEDFTTELKTKLENMSGGGSGGGTQVNADWNATSGPAQILHKPANVVSDPQYVHTDANFTLVEKNKLARIAEGATNTVVDTSISGTSQNPVQNRIIKAELDRKVSKTDVDDSLSFSSQNPVQNRTVTAGLNAKVDKVSGKGLSQNDFTDGQKAKLEGIEAGATRTVIDNAISGASTNPVQNRAIKEALDRKIDIDAARQLTEENFTASMRAKLEGIEAGAQRNVKADWTSSSGDSMILNKPLNLVQDADYVHTDENFTKKYRNKLESIEEGARKIIIDAVLSYTSENPLQNKAIANVLKKYGVGLNFTHEGGTYKLYLMGPDGKQLGGAFPIGDAATVYVYDTDETVMEFGEKPVKGKGIYEALRQLQYDLEFDEEDYSLHLVNPDGSRVGNGAVIGDSKIAYKYATAGGYTGTDEEYYDLLYQITQDFEEVMKYHDYYWVGTTLYLNRGQFAGTTLFL